MLTTLRSFMRTFVTLLLAYAVVFSFAAPMLTRQALAASPAGKSSSWRHLLTPSLPQSSGQRSGELLIRFRSNVAQQGRANLLASHGLRSKRQLQGESGAEKLEVLSGQNPETVAQLLRLQPEVEFAEPNFLINKDQLVTSDPQFPDQWGLRNTGQAGG